MSEKDWAETDAALARIGVSIVNPGPREPQPTTRAGRRLFTDNEPMDMWESTVTPEDIVKVEAEARAESLREIGHVWRNIDPEAPCPVCGFPAWSHDPATAVLYSRAILSEPKP